MIWTKDNANVVRLFLTSELKQIQEKEVLHSDVCIKTLQMKLIINDFC